MPKLFTKSDLERCARLAFRLHGVETSGSEWCVQEAVREIAAEAPEYLTKEQWEHLP